MAKPRHITMSDGTKLMVKVYGDDGNPNKPVLIGHHGAPGASSHEETETSYKHLSDRFRVVVYDARGSGVSERKSPFALGRWVQDLEEIRQWMKVDQFLLGGGSHGGAVAIQYALGHRERLLGLILRDTFADGAVLYDNAMDISRKQTRLPRQPNMQLQEKLWTGKLESDTEYAIALTEVAAAFPYHTSAPSPAVNSETIDSSTFCFEAANGGLGASCRSWNVLPQLHELEGVKTFVAVGRHDLITPVSCSQDIANGIGKSAELHIFDKSGHSPPEEEPEEWIRVLDEWLRGLGT